MTKKKAAGKKASKKSAKTKAKKGKQELNAKEVRKEVAQMVKLEATVMAKAVIDEGKKGQLATVKYLFEMAEIHPESTDGSQATADEDSLAKTLLRRMNLPEEPIARNEDEDEGKPALAEKGAARVSEEGSGTPGGVGGVDESEDSAVVGG